MHGQSAYTWFKETRFTAVLAQSLRISKADSVKRFSYYHVDLHAGSGFNEFQQVAGSPLNFVAAAERHDRLNFYAFFVDHDPNCIRALVRRAEIAAHPSRISVFQSDNAEVLPVVSAFIAKRERNPQYAMGTILIDPNGYHNGVPWDALRIFCADHPRMDIVMNLNIFTFKRERGQFAIGKGKWGAKKLRPVSEFPTLFARPNWMVTQVTQIKGHSWSQFVGRTIRTSDPNYRYLGFYDIHSERGQAIISDIENEGGGPQSGFLFHL